MRMRQRDDVLFIVDGGRALRWRGDRSALSPSRRRRVFARISIDDSGAVGAREVRSESTRGLNGSAGMIGVPVGETDGMTVFRLVEISP